MNSLPRYSFQLVEELDSIFPVKRITPETNYNEALYQAGQRSVVDFLLKVKENSDVLDETP